MITQSDIKNAAVARRYSGALLDLAKENGMLKEFEDELQKIADGLGASEELAGILQHPTVSLDKKKEIAFELFSKVVSEKTMNFVYLLLEKNRIGILPSVLNFYRDLKNKEEKVLYLTVTSAVEIPDDLRTSLLKKLKDKFSKDIVPEYIVDESIIAGLIIKSQDNVIDISYRTKFENMKKQLI